MALSPFENLPQYTFFLPRVTNCCEADLGVTVLFFPGGFGPALSVVLRLNRLDLDEKFSVFLGDRLT